MGKISNYLEMIEDIKNKTPEKEAFCTGNSSLTYRELFLVVKEKQKKWKTAAKKELYFIQKEQALDQLTEFLTCQGMGYVPVILQRIWKKIKNCTDTKILCRNQKCRKKPVWQL